MPHDVAVFYLELAGEFRDFFSPQFLLECMFHEEVSLTVFTFMVARSIHKMHHVQMHTSTFEGSGRPSNEQRRLDSRFDSCDSFAAIFLSQCLSSGSGISR